MARPFVRSSLPDLEAAFDREHANPQFLSVLLDELTHRSTNRAARLRVRAEAALEAITASVAERAPAVIASGSEASREAWAGVPKTDRPPSSSKTRASESPPCEPDPIPPIADAPVEVLAAWTALEVLSPQTFRRPEDLAGGDRRAVALLDGARLPWEVGETSRPRTRLYYQIVLGTVDMEAAAEALLAAYADTRVERPAAKGHAVLGVITVDRDGRPVEEGVAISSFGWALPSALNGQLRSLGDWPGVEQGLTERFDQFLHPGGPEQISPILDRASIQRAFEWLLNALGTPPELVGAPMFAIRSYQYFKDPDPPDPLLLNSFFLNDLATAAELFRRNQPTANLRRYFGAQSPTNRQDLLGDAAAVRAAVRPTHIPPARWPGPGRFPLVLLQQAAVNLALCELRSDGILAVNGPPGTGKTTLLRDIVAAIVTERARVMSRFEDPETAFEYSGQRMKAGNGWLHLYRLDSALRGFEMLVASSNNKAVENVSAELPARSAIAADAGRLRYFKALSDELLEQETWGLIAGVLGNAANRAQFRQRFWWNEDVGMATYLAAAAGTPQEIEVKDPASGELIKRTPRVVTEEDAPQSHEQALIRWREARTVFNKALARCEALLGQLDQMSTLADRIPEFITAHQAALKEFDQARVDLSRAAAAFQQATDAHRCAKQFSDAAASDAKLRREVRPGLLSRLFRTRFFRAWREAYNQTLETARRTALETANAREYENQAARELQSVQGIEAAARRNLEIAQQRRTDAERQVEACRAKVGTGFIDCFFFDRPHAERHQVAPWLDNADHRARDDLFIAAMNLHKAFIDAAAKPLRHNLGALMNVFGRGQLNGAEKEALRPDLWASLFIVVPVLSTTFASVERMLRELPPASLGWLLIDEAGQALPQAAVGALMRTRRAVIVGDPQQIEPIVPLPDALTEALCRRFGVDPSRFNAPLASAQTLADAATPYFAEFAGRHGSRTVGVPLLVHRRCAGPMFGIANAIAYERLMVDAKRAAPSLIRELLGPSRWFDVHGSAEDKWCREEGEVVLSLLKRIAAARLAPDLYIVTPFVIVRDNLRRMVDDSRVLDGWLDDSWRWIQERVGTVHTVQGREAEAVLFVLGAPAPQQSGARGWAGGKPNLLNVAVTRAREVLYVVGNRQLWREAGLFCELDARMPT